MWLLNTEAAFETNNALLDGMGGASQWAAGAAERASEVLIRLGARYGFYTENDFDLHIKRAMRETEDARKGLSLAQYVIKCDAALDRMLEIAKNQSRSSSIDGTYFALQALESKICFQPVIDKIRKLASQHGYKEL